MGEALRESWFVYIIETGKAQLYTGVAKDVERRFQEHLARHTGDAKKGAKFFLIHEPRRVVYRESFASRSAAQRREYQIKQLSRREKCQLIEAQQ